MKPRVLIVDGHSMIFQWSDLAAQHARRGTTARENLIRLLTSLQDNSHWTVAVVFDGKGAKPNEASEPDGITVLYSRDGQTADSIIERLAAKYRDTYDVTVATDDHMERTTVESFGAGTMSSFQLRAEIDQAGRDLQDRLKRLR